MKALSLWQPWATLVMIGAKRIETRSWSTSHRGDLLIHAANKSTHEQIELRHEDPFRSALAEAGYRRWQDLPLGKMLGQVQLDDCLEIVEPDSPLRPGTMYPPPMPELAFGRYEPGRYGMPLSSPRPFGTPIPYRAQQRMFSVHPETLGFL